MKTNLKLFKVIAIIALIMCSGFNAKSQITPLFNETNSIFKDKMNIIFWADFNNDGLKDILALGSVIGNYGDSIYLYQNTGNKTFEILTSIKFEKINHPVANCADFDNDGFMDIIISGNIKGDEKPEYHTYLYKNNGDLTFTKMPSDMIPGLVFGNISTIDFDNDGKTDFLFCGQNEAGKVFSTLYKNRGNFVFTPISTPFKNVRNGSSEWADYDNDGFPDLLLSGVMVTPNAQFIKVAEVYKNNKNGTFTLQNDISLEGISDGSAKWGDYDNDGDLDILIAGDFFGVGTFKLYNNDGAGRFSEVTSFNFNPLAYSAMEWEDFDNDGDLDVFYTGLLWDTEKNEWNPKTSLFIYDTTYHEISMAIETFNYPTSTVADMDNNRNLDISFSGYVQPYSLKTGVLLNISQPNTAPSVPVNLTATQNGKIITLNWDKSIDTETNSSALTYSLRIGTHPGGLDVFSPCAIDKDGTKLKFENGQIHKIDSGYFVCNLLPGKYYWSIQAIDAGYLASNFAIEDSFTVENYYFPPKPPVNLESTVISENIIDLTWVNQENDETGFIIERSEKNDQNFQIADSVGNNLYSYRDKNLSSGTKYYYRIKTLVNDSTSSYSDTISNETWPLPMLSKIFDGEIVKDKLSSTDAAWGDFNNDGWMDLCVTNYNSPNQIFKNRGDGTFSQIELPDSGNSRGVNWVDINNDGYLDLFIIQGYFYPNLIYINNQNETFTKITNSNIAVDMGETYSAAWADFDKDGLIDVFICNVDSTNKLYRNLGDYQFESVNYGESDLHPMNSVGCNWVDYDNDGNLDLFVANYYNPNCLYKNNGNGSFIKITEGEIVSDAEPSVSGAWGDFDNDGDFDLLVANNVNQDNSFYENTGNGTFSKSKIWPFANRGGIMGGGNGASWEDIDNDGDLDLFIANAYDNQLYINNGEGNFSTIADEPVCRDYGYSIAALWADYNNDGNIDLFIPNGDNQANYLYKNNGFPLLSTMKSQQNSNNRVIIKLKGKKSNSFGLGAKVSVESGNISATRYISVQSGAISSINNLYASVGIGQNTNAKIKITWPSGIVQNISSIDINKVNIIEEAESDTNIGESIRTDFRLYPNPVSSDLYLKLNNSDESLIIRLTDVSGKLIHNIPLINNKNNIITVDVKNITPGIFLIIVEDKNEKTIKKFCKIN